MYNLRLDFSNPWWLLLLLPAIALTLIPYFRLAKRYRKTRNRITSMALHLAVTLFAVCLLSGMAFKYEVPNTENEIILLVDVSDTEEQSAKNRDAFVETVLKDSRYDGFKVGVVTFGFDQKYIVPLTYNVAGIYKAYQEMLEIECPDASATDIASALEYTATLFNNPETAKIVLVTDGKETDREANSVIRAVAANGIRVDVAHVTSQYEGDDVQLLDVVLPDRYVAVGDPCSIGLSLQSVVATEAEITLTVEGEELGSISSSQTVKLEKGENIINFTHAFAEDGLNEIVFSVAPSEDDFLTQNSTYCTYMYLQEFNKLLILERAEGESTELVKLLNDGTTEEKPRYVIDVKNVGDNDVPKTAEAFCNYDQVIMNNIANADMPDGLAARLEEYVNVYGGGMFTVGGKDQDGNANAYNREDMYGTTYQRMLPVEAIKYTPPVGVIFIVDRSGSMGDSSGGQTKLQLAVQGVSASLQSLTERDYIGIMTLDNAAGSILELTPRTQEAKILAALSKIQTAGGGTVFSDAIMAAGLKLRAETRVERRHIVIVTDGQAGEPPEEYLSIAKDLYEDPDRSVTISVVGIDINVGLTISEMKKLCEETAGGRFIAAASNDDLIFKMKEELNEPAIEQVIYETFNPLVANELSPIVKDISRLENQPSALDFTIDGFYGVKVRPTADLILTGEYNVPLYAQWKYGAGTVGSFMCDLQGAKGWSADLMASEHGKKLIRNMVTGLMPVTDIRPKDIRMDLKENNYTNQMSVYTDIEEGGSVKGTITPMFKGGEQTPISLNEVTAQKTGNCYVLSPLSAANQYARCTLIVKETGVYKITLIKYNAAGKEVSSMTAYKTFSFSDEYDVELDAEVLETEKLNTADRLATLAQKGNGSVIKELDDPIEVFKDFVTALTKTYDPKFVLAILAIVAFLLDIAVRKFKFKWPHELIREWKEKKNSQQ